MEALKNNHEHTHTARITHKWADTKEVFPQATTIKCRRIWMGSWRVDDQRACFVVFLADGIISLIFCNDESFLFGGFLIVIHESSKANPFNETQRILFCWFVQRVQSPEQIRYQSIKQMLCDSVLHLKWYLSETFSRLFLVLFGLFHMFIALFTLPTRVFSVCNSRKSQLFCTMSVRSKNTAPIVTFCPFF